MDQDQAEGKWDRINRRAKLTWSEFIENDFRKSEDSMGKLSGVIQKKFGAPREASTAQPEKLHLK